MRMPQGLRERGVQQALGAALLFGAATPLAKRLLQSVDPWQLAGLFYLGSGIGLSLYRRIARAPAVHMSRTDVPWLIGAIAVGGIVAPVLLMLGLTRMPASGASLLLNAEGVFTALLAWFAFKEHVSVRIAVGMGSIALGALVISWPDHARFAGAWPALAVLGACFAWGIDNNLTRKVSLTDAGYIAAAKGLVAGTVNIALAFALGAHLPSPSIIAISLIVGLFAYGASLVLFVLALRNLGTGRTGAYFSTAPFAGALLALLWGDPWSMSLVIAGLLMVVGIGLHITERHDHQHVHEPLEHEHEHTHDAHHQHLHEPPVAPGTTHTHRHRHAPLTHRHAHFPDAHHRHPH
jgi:drug/metabolite transporter (DMT)-like permease